MRVDDLSKVSALDDTIRTLHSELATLYQERANLLAKKKVSEPHRKRAINEIDLSEIDLSL